MTRVEDHQDLVKMARKQTKDLADLLQAYYTSAKVDVTPSGDRILLERLEMATALANGDCPVHKGFYTIDVRRVSDES